MNNTNTKIKKETVIGDVFIVPNRLDNGLVQVWVTGSGSENWCDHGHPEFKERFPYALPAELFMGKVEGDVVELEHNCKNVQLKLNQTDYRYRRFGTFDEVFNNLTNYKYCVA